MRSSQNDRYHNTDNVGYGQQQLNNAADPYSAGTTGARPQGRGRVQYDTSNNQYMQKGQNDPNSNNMIQNRMMPSQVSFGGPGEESRQSRVAGNYQTQQSHLQNDKPINLDIDRNYFSSNDDEHDNLDEGYGDLGQAQDISSRHGQNADPYHEPDGRQQHQENDQRPDRMTAAGRGAQTAGPPRRSFEPNESQRNSQHQYSRAEASALVDNYKYDNFGQDSDEDKQIENDYDEKQDVGPRGGAPGQKRGKRQPATLKNRNEAIVNDSKHVGGPATHWNQSSIDEKKSDFLMTSKMYGISDNSQYQKERMYEDLYHKVVDTKPQHRLAVDKNSTFETYKEGWNQIQDKVDSEYQRRLHRVNKDAIERMELEHQKQQEKLRQLKVQAEHDKEQQEREQCTFSPRIATSAASKRLKEKVGDRSGKSYHKAQEQFLAKKDQWMAKQQLEKERHEQGLQAKGFMSKGSRKIMQEKSRTLNGSNSESTFLQRNYYNPRDKSITNSISRLSNMDNKGLRGRDNKQRARDLSASSNYLRDISGSKMSFLNSSTASQRGAGLGSRGERLFSPQINEKSRLMSPRDKDATFNMLHQQAIYQQRKQQLKSYEAEKNAVRDANKNVSVNVNKESDTQLIKQFYNEFCLIIQNQIQQSNQVYLVDVLDQLHFISEDGLMRQSIKLNAMINQYRKSLYIDTESGSFAGASEDVTKNLFKICCAIMNYRPKQRDQNKIDDQVLRSYLDQINEQRSGRDMLIIDQLTAIKNLANRRAFSLGDKQIAQIHLKFQNLSQSRKDYIYGKHKTEGKRRIKREVTPTHQPQISTRSRDLDRSTLGADGQKRTDVMYSYAAKYKEHREALQEEYKDKEVEGLNFTPKLNITSIKFATKSASNFNERTMNHYKNKHNREDRDPEAIEYEKNMHELSFKPKISSSKAAPQTVQLAAARKSPAFRTIGDNSTSRSPMGRAPNYNTIIAKRENLIKARKESNGKPEQVKPEVVGPSLSKVFKTQQKQNPYTSTNMAAQQKAQGKNTFFQEQEAKKQQAERIARNVDQNRANQKDTRLQDQFLSRSPYKTAPPRAPYEPNQQPRSRPQDQDLQFREPETFPEPRNDPPRQQNSPSRDLDSRGQQPINIDTRTNQGNYVSNSAKPSPSQPLSGSTNYPSPFTASTPKPSNPQMQHIQPPSALKRSNLTSYLPVVEEPICVLKIELDGEHIEEIKVFENDDPKVIVNKFGNQFNLSQNARQRLLEQIEEQIQMDDEYE